MFISASPLTMNRFNGSHSWQDTRKIAFTSDPIGTSFSNPNTTKPNNAYEISFIENRQSRKFNSGDEYMSAMSGSIPAVYFNNNTSGPANAPYSPLFHRSCIDNLDFGNSMFYGVSSLSSATQNSYGNLAYSATQGNLAQTNWNFGGNSGEIVTSQNKIINQEGKYYLNSLDWLINRSSIGANMTKNDYMNHLLAPLNPHDIWNNSYNFLTDPLSFFDLNRSYQLYPLTLLPKLVKNSVTPENGNPVQITVPDSPEFHNLAWISPPPDNGDSGAVPYAPIITNTKWTTRFSS
jgi:hypothetical protein